MSVQFLDRTHRIVKCYERLDLWYLPDIDRRDRSGPQRQDYAEPSRTAPRVNLPAAGEPSRSVGGRAAIQAGAIGMRQQTKLSPRERYRMLVEHVALNQQPSNIADVLESSGKTTDDLRQDVETYRRSRLGILDGSQIR